MSLFFFCSIMNMSCSAFKGVDLVDYAQKNSICQNHAHSVLHHLVSCSEQKQMWCSQMQVLSVLKYENLGEGQRWAFATGTSPWISPESSSADTLTLAAQTSHELVWLTAYCLAGHSHHSRCEFCHAWHLSLDPFEAGWLKCSLSHLPLYFS